VLEIVGVSSDKKMTNISTLMAFGLNEQWQVVWVEFSLVFLIGADLESNEKYKILDCLFSENAFKVLLRQRLTIFLQSQI
jgi:hypothetical protein